MNNLNSLFGAVKTSFAAMAQAAGAPTAPAAPQPPAAPRMVRDAFQTSPESALKLGMMRLTAMITKGEARLDQLANERNALGRNDWQRFNQLQLEGDRLGRDLRAPRALASAAESILANPAATQGDRMQLQLALNTLTLGGSNAAKNRAVVYAQDAAWNIGRSPASDRGLHGETLALVTRMGETQDDINALETEMRHSISGQRTEQIRIEKMALETHLGNAQNLKFDADALSFNPNASPESVAKMKSLVAEMAAGASPARQTMIVAQARALSNGTPAPLARALEGVARRAGQVEREIAALTDEVKMGAGGQRLQEIQILLQDLHRDAHVLHKIAVRTTQAAKLGEGPGLAELTRMAREVATGVKGERLEQIAAQLEPR